ncbi:MAG TPA: alpha/beta fold hydrolase [Lacunisphaera sp.]|nr:alpha/beta fold hydrolase [Lacunisphaera sp.]
MLPRLFALLVAASCAVTLLAESPTPHLKLRTLVSVHGAWAGGWQMKKVAPLLEAQGWKVYRPSLPGLGEHHHLASPNISLEDHITDIVDFILFEDLHDVILLGHSYGGMVITGVADRIPERIARLVYLDAFLPLEGESLVTTPKGGGEQLDLDAMTKDGFIIPTWVKPGRPLPKDVPHPARTVHDPIHLTNPAAAKIPGTYILTVEPGKKPEDDTFFPSAERAKARGWPVIIMEADHVPQWRKPEATAELLLRLP